MKRWFVASAVALGLAACGGDAGPGSEEGEAGKPDEAVGDEAPLAPATPEPDRGLAPPDDPHLPF